MVQNRQWRLKSRPDGLLKTEHVTFDAEPLRALGPAEVLLELEYLSMDPALQVFVGKQRKHVRASANMNEGADTPSTEAKSLIINEGDVLRTWGVGRIIASNSPLFPVGSYARDHDGICGFQDYCILHQSELIRVDPTVAPLPAHLGVLGMPGLTAYFGMLEVGAPKPNDVVVVSGASGAVGSVAGQVARLKGCRVIGIAGGPDKCRYIVEELGFHDCIDYKSSGFAEALLDACPNLIDVYYDNVGGKILDLCLGHMARKGRIVSCGAVAEYANVGEWSGLKNYMSILVQDLTWRGVMYYDYRDKFQSALNELAGWIKSGELRHSEEIGVGLENFVQVYHRLFTGKGLGKLVLRTR